MTFTPEERKALAALDEAFGPLDEESPLSIEPAVADAYLRSARSYAVNAVSLWKSYEMAINPALPDIKAKLIEEKRRLQSEKDAARAVEVRENHISGVLSGLIPRALKAGRVEFQTSNALIEISLFGREGLIFYIEYDRGDFMMSAHLNGDDLAVEDWGALSGNKTMREQSPAFAAVSAYLDGLGEG